MLTQGERERPNSNLKFSWILQVLGPHTHPNTCKYPQTGTGCTYSYWENIFQLGTHTEFFTSKCGFFEQCSSNQGLTLYLPTRVFSLHAFICDWVNWELSGNQEHLHVAVCPQLHGILSSLHPRVWRNHKCTAPLSPSHTHPPSTQNINRIIIENSSVDRE